MAAPVHRKNSDSTWDSICLGCFQTIARAEIEAKLREQEREHICIPLQFSQEINHSHSNKDAGKVVEMRRR